MQMKHMISSYATLVYVNDHKKGRKSGLLKEGKHHQLVSSGSDFENEGHFTNDLSGFY